jgi:23S rRNA (uracil1939-C5)-methyltransferase/tRNA (uracil-5-)-methyltransferase
MTSDSSTNTVTEEPTKQNNNIVAPSHFRPGPFLYHEILENVEIEGLTHRGWGVARISLDDIQSARLKSSSSSPTPRIQDDDDDETTTTSKDDPKWVVMVPNVIPGEVVQVRIFRNFGNYSEGDLVQVLQPSPHRVIPQCSLFGVCGGCQYQHMDIPYQRNAKRQSVMETLSQFGILTQDAIVQNTVGSEHVYKYRSKITPHFQAPVSNLKRKKRNKDEPSAHAFLDVIGFQHWTSRQLVDVESCIIATDAVNEAYQSARKHLLETPYARKKGATLFFREQDGGIVSTDSREIITTTVGNLQFQYRAGNFFQNNNHVLPLMVQMMRDGLKSEDAHKITHLVDCYCGSGLFALSCADIVDTVVGIEINESAIVEAKANAVINHISNVEFLSASAEAIFRDIADFPAHNTAVILDPPRKGCDDVFLSQLIRFQPQRILYMSCDPTTQARDIASHLNADYEIRTVIPVDLFPQTRHIECFIVLERKNHANQ